ncbi:hypothetical protein M422DRAFT_42257 [Sphaerobolus stellatus SS14]|nr:hypothetical protein M422DRAFT_42257 [Sphaerobolus stellatus SS14]
MQIFEEATGLVAKRAIGPSCASLWSHLHFNLKEILPQKIDTVSEFFLIAPSLKDYFLHIEKGTIRDHWVRTPEADMRLNEPFIYILSVTQCPSLILIKYLSSSLMVEYSRSLIENFGRHDVSVGDSGGDVQPRHSVGVCFRPQDWLAVPVLLETTAGEGLITNILSANPR